MKFTLSLLGIEAVSLEVSIPRLGMFAPGFLPDSIEATETWGGGDE